MIPKETSIRYFLMFTLCSQLLFLCFVASINRSPEIKKTVKKNPVDKRADFKAAQLLQ